MNWILQKLDHHIVDLDLGRELVKLHRFGRQQFVFLAFAVGEIEALRGIVVDNDGRDGYSPAIVQHNLSLLNRLILVLLALPFHVYHAESHAIGVQDHIPAIDPQFLQGGEVEEILIELVLPHQVVISLVGMHLHQILNRHRALYFLLHHHLAAARQRAL